MKDRELDDRINISTELLGSDLGQRLALMANNPRGMRLERRGVRRSVSGYIASLAAQKQCNEQSNPYVLYTHLPSKRSTQHFPGCVVQAFGRSSMYRNAMHSG